MNVDKDQTNESMELQKIVFLLIITQLKYTCKIRVSLVSDKIEPIFYGYLPEMVINTLLSQFVVSDRKTQVSLPLHYLSSMEVDTNTSHAFIFGTQFKYLHNLTQLPTNLAHNVTYIDMTEVTAHRQENKVQGLRRV